MYLGTLHQPSAPEISSFEGDEKPLILILES